MFSCSPTVGPVGATESCCQNGYKHVGQFAALENSKNVISVTILPLPLLALEVMQAKSYGFAPLIDLYPYNAKFIKSCISLTMLAGEGRGVLSFDQRKTEIQ